MSAKCTCEQWFDNADDDEPGVRGHSHRDAGDGCTAPGCACEFNAPRVFKSRQVNLDPWWGPNVKPGMVVPGGGLVVPRPEFEPTRDPKPWLTPGTFDAPGDTRHADQRSGSSLWAPRREEFDTPVNRVLVDARAIGWRDPNTLDQYPDTDWSADEIDHARKVLTRLAGFQKRDEQS